MNEEEPEIEGWCEDCDSPEHLCGCDPEWDPMDPTM